MRNVNKLLWLPFVLCLLPSAGAVACAQARTGQRVAAEKFPGADLGAKINAADKALGAGPGEITVSSGGTVRTQVVVSPGHTLRLASGTYASEVGGSTYLLKDGASLRCGGSAVLLESTAPNTSGTGVGPLGSSLFTIVQDYAGGTRNGDLSRNIEVSGCTFRGARPEFNSAYQTVSMGNCHNCRVEGNRLEKTRTIGIQLGGGSMYGNYASNSSIARNEFVGVASQNAAITNCVGCRVEQNRFIAPGQAGGPGVSVIDVEPNVGDRTTDVTIADNLIDATASPLDAGGHKVTNGIVVQNGNGANPFGNVVVRGNTVIGAKHTQGVYNNIAYAGILVRTAAGVTVRQNKVIRVAWGILLDYGTTGATVEENELISCGSGSTFAFHVLDSTRNVIARNVLRDEPTDVLKLGERATTLIEAGASDRNTFSGNRGNVGVSGRNSRKLQD